MTQKLQILLVEDNPGDARLISEYLTSIQTVLIEIDNAKELGECKNYIRNKHYDVILLDLNLPDSKGIDTIRNVLKISNGTPIVVLTGLADEEIAFEAIQIGAQDYLVKDDIDSNVLLKTIRYAQERHQLINQVKKERDKAQSYLDIVNAIIVVINRDQIVTMINKCGCDILGYKEPEILGQNWFDKFIPKKDRRTIKKVYREIITGKSMPHQYYENHVLTKDETLKFISWHNSIIYNNKSEIVSTLSYGEDITEKKKQQVALAQSEAQFRSLYETMAQGVVYQDTNGKIISANPAAEKILGMTFDQMQGRKSIDPCFKSIHEDGTNFPGEDHPAMEALYTGKKVNDVLMGVYNPKEDANRWIKINAVPQFRKSESKPYRVYTTFYDITEIKLAKEALVNSEKKYRTLTENQSIAIYRSTPGKEGQLIEINPAMAVMFGFNSKEEMLKTKASDNYYDPFDRKEFSEGLLLNGVVKNREIEFKRKDGSTFIGSDTAVAVKNDIGEIIYFDGVIEDITDRKRLEQMLIQSEKMASIGTLAAGVAHEINNPIGYISSNLRIMEKYSEKLSSFFIGMFEMINNYEEGKCEETKQAVMKAKDDMNLDYLLEDMNDALAESIEGIEKVKRIVHDLKDFAHPDKPDIAYADINESIEKTLNIVWNEIKYKAEVIKEYSEIPKIECDIQKLSQVFMNLLVNASHAITEKGIITIKTYSENENIVVNISDNGRGMERDQLKHIFDAFYTTKEPGKGTGLGLSISYRIIQEHFGKIDVWSELGKGTEFTIKLPVSLKHQAVKEKRILIVDDEEDVNKMLMMMIKRVNPSIEVEKATSGFEAGEKLFTFRPNLVFLDIFMPDMDGFEVTKRIINSDLKDLTKIVIITGGKAENLKDKALEAGAVHFLRKPFGQKKINEIIEEHL